MQSLTLLTAASQGGDGGSPLFQFLPLILIVVVIYFFMIRPQQKKAKEQKEFRENVQKGDKIVTIGGIHAKIVEVNDDDVVIDPGNNQKLTIERSAISMESSQQLQQKDSKSSE